MICIKLVPVEGRGMAAAQISTWHNKTRHKIVRVGSVPFYWRKDTELMELLICVVLSVWGPSMCYWLLRGRNPRLWAQAITGVEKQLQWYAVTGVSIHQWCVLLTRTECHVIRSVFSSASCPWTDPLGEVAWPWCLQKWPDSPILTGKEHH